MSELSEHGFDGAILLGRGGYSSAPEAQLRAMVEAVQTQQILPHVTRAFVDQGAPRLPAALDALVAAGARSIVVLPVFVPSDRNLQRWLVKVIARWHADRSHALAEELQGERIAVHMAEALGDHAVLGDAVVRALENVRVEHADIAADPPKEWARDPDGWSEIPAHSRHILFCRGPRCTSRGADDLYRDFLMSARSAREAFEGVESVATGCLFPCNLGPLMVVYPEGAWYGHLDAARIQHIVKEHLGNGRIVEECVVGRPIDEANHKHNEQHGDKDDGIPND